MDLKPLKAVTNRIQCRGIDADQFVVIGKETNTISFRAPRSQYMKVARLCEDFGYVFHTSMDTFIAREMDRYQLHLDGVCPASRPRRTHAELAADNFEPRSKHDRHI